MMKKDTGPGTSKAYANYTLMVLVIVYIFNFIDRQILSILAEDIKAHLGVGDAALGFLYGTAFAVFYAVFGIPLGRLADIWVRKSLISVGVGFWSLMTALSGTAQSFSSLAAYRIGVGIGESSATPAAFSMLSDYFPPEKRATALAIYSSGIYIGAGIGIFLGGWILDSWNSIYPDPQSAPMGLHGWQAAFLAVGVPGLLVALWVATLREPQRGLNEGLPTSGSAQPFAEFWRELATVLPGPNLLILASYGAPGRRQVVVNLITAALIAALAFVLIKLTGSLVQWSALGVGAYAAFSWIQKLWLRDTPTFSLIFRSRTLLFCVPGVAFIAFISYGFGFWAAPYFIRYYGASETEVGLFTGLATAIGGFAGVTSGGILSDVLRRRHQTGRLLVGVLSVVLTAFSGSLLMWTENKVVAYCAFFVFVFCSPMWIGPAASTVNDLVLPRMRAVASAMYILIITFIGLALGPYSIGLVSQNLAASLGSEAEALRQALTYSLLALVPALILLVLACRYLAGDEGEKIVRAQAAGEEIASPGST